MLNSRLTAVALFFLALIRTATGADAVADKITYDDHIRPIFRQHCLACHSADSKKGDLALDSFAATLEGGASGEVVFESDLDSSRLWDLVSHADEPIMPPNADKLPDDTLDLIRRWIEGGVLENSGSVAKTKKKPGLAMITPTATGKPDGPAAMPERLYREPVVYSSRAAAVTALATSPWAPLVAVAGQRQVSLYHTESAALLGVLPFLDGTPYVLTFSRDGSLLLVAGGRGAAVGLAALYDVRTGSRLVAVGDEFDAALAADVNPSVSLIALGGPQKIVRVFRVADGSLAFEIRKHTDWITAIAFSPDGELLVTADRNGGAFLWEAETGREVGTLRGHQGAVNAASWRADSQITATAGADGSIRFWNREEGKQVKSWTAHAGGAESVCFAPDGRLVTTGRDRMVKLWKPDGGHIKDLATFGDIALAASISHDGKRIVAGDYTGEIRLIDVENGQTIGAPVPNPPTLAMRVAAAIQKMEAAEAALGVATVAKQKSDEAMAAAEVESGRRAAVLADMRAKLGEVEAHHGGAAADVEAKKQSIAVAETKVNEATNALAAVSAEVQSIEAAMRQTREKGEDSADAEQAFLAATAKAKDAIARIATAQVAMKAADQAHEQAVAHSSQMGADLAAAQTAVQTAQAAVEAFAGTLGAARESVAARAHDLSVHKELVVAASQSVASSKSELADFSAAKEKFAAAISQAEAHMGEAASAANAARMAEQAAAADLAAKKVVADEAAEKLAAAKAEFEQLSRAMNESRKIQEQKSQDAANAARVHSQAEAAAAQAKEDLELIEKANEMRQKYAENK